eukprot:gene866-51_t
MRWARLVAHVILIGATLIVIFSSVDGRNNAIGNQKSSFFTEKSLGSLEDTKCNVEVVQEANAAPLSSIFGALLNSTFFRLFRVDVEQRCEFFQKEKPEEFRCSAEPDNTAPPGFASAGPSFTSSSNSPSFSSPGSESGAEEGRSFCSLSPPEEDLDSTITRDEDEATSAFVDASCDDEELPPFWLDMCSTIHTNSSKYINLQLNDERNTGYNGSHIWKAIYEENCVWREEGPQVDEVYEEKVLRRLLSGMHASTSISVAWRYTAPRRGSTEWKPSPNHFMKVFGDTPEYLKNLHFTFVVMLRALRRATPFLYNYNYNSGDKEQDDRTTMLMHHLLDSHVLSLCSAVFDGFDETTLFRQQSSKKEKKRQFKTVFQNIANVVNCVKCQSCRLHAKLHILGIGTALKILLLPNDLLDTSIGREEVVAFVNTIGAFSESVTRSQKLTEMYWDRQAGASSKMDVATSTTSSSTTSTKSSIVEVPSSVRSIEDINSAPALDNAIGLTARTYEAGLLTEAAHAALIQLVLNKDTGLLSLAWHYRTQPENFAKLAGQHVGSIKPKLPTVEHDCIIIGTGLAGLVTALSMLDRGGNVILVEKETRIGGNSGKASSGINAAPADDYHVFYEDTKKSAGDRVTPLLDTFVEKTEAAVNWLRDRVGVNLDNVLQLGGHTEKRTYRPTTGMIGAEVTFAAGNEVKRFIKEGQLTLKLQTTAKSIAMQDGKVVGLVVADKDGNEEVLSAPTVVLASGGAELTINRPGVSYTGTTPRGSRLPSPHCRLPCEIKDTDLESIVFPEVVTIGDGQLFLESSIFLTSATLRKLKSVGSHDCLRQPLSDVDSPDLFSNGIHFHNNQRLGAIDSPFAADRSIVSINYLSPFQFALAVPTRIKDLNNRPDLEGFPTTLGNWTTGDGIRMATEVGGYTVDMDKVQLHPTGFVDPAAPEDRTKTLCAEVMRGAGGILFNGKMKRFVNELATRQHVVDKMLENPSPYTLILNEDAGNEVNRHTTLYSRKGLLKKVEGGVKELAMLLGISKDQLLKELKKYQSSCKKQKDEFGKTNFIHGEVLDESDHATWWVGEVTPVVHYTMGGIAVDTSGKVLSKATDKPIPGLYAAGEASGGLHGDNRLAGNSLSECTVFGRIVGEDIPIVTTECDSSLDSGIPDAGSTEEDSAKKEVVMQKVDKAILESHSKQEDCWIALYDRVYDFTGYGEEHPGGAEAICTILILKRDFNSQCAREAVFWIELPEKSCIVRQLATILHFRIYEYCGQDASETFIAVHNAGMLTDFDDLLVGEWLEAEQNFEL